MQYQKKIGIMGGTFDPIHNAHLELGRWALSHADLDEIWFMPDRQPPHKKGRPVTAAFHRCRMTELAVSGQPGFVCSLFEQNRTGFTYTSDTLRELKENYPAYCFYFIVGADSLYEIETWHEPAQVMKQTILLVAKRFYTKNTVHGRTLEEQAEYLREFYHAEIILMDFPTICCSSTAIREMVAKGQDISNMVPPPVNEYILEHHLYRGDHAAEKEEFNHE